MRERLRPGVCWCYLKDNGSVTPGTITVTITVNIALINMNNSVHAINYNDNNIAGITSRAIS